MNVVIVEDERPAAERLRKALSDYDSRIRVAAHLQTVADTIDWFESHASPDLLFLDVRLTDGLSLEVFSSARVSCPVVFTTAYDAYVLDAFDCNSIDYLLKPIRPERLAQAMQKYDQLKRHFAGDLAHTLRAAFNAEPKTFKKRLIVQRGAAFVSMPAEEIQYAFSKHKTTFVVDRNGTQFVCDEALTSLEEMLDPDRFFRVNRKYLARIEAVASFRQASRGRIRVEMEPAAGEAILISQEKASRFRAWIDR